MNKQDKWLTGWCGYDIKDKTAGINYYVRYMLNRMQAAFRWDGLPDSIPQRNLELYLQCNGNAAIIDHNGTLYAVTGGRGGEPDPYYMPTLYTVANPALNLSKNYRIGSECVVIPNDSTYNGLLPMFCRYASQLVENDITLRMADINLRLQNIITAPGDTTAKAAREYLKQLESGELGAILDDEFRDRINVHSVTAGSSGYITQLIELEQYLKASWYNDIGIDANYNMKREVLNDGETEQNRSALLPLIDDMLTCRQRAAREINTMYGTNITVDLTSAWKDERVDTTTPDNTDTPEGGEGIADDAE